MEYDTNVAEAIRYEYFKQLKREKQIGQPNSRLDDAVAKAAVICASLDCDPTVYVAAQVVAFPQNQINQFFPSHLHTKHAVDNVHKYKSIVHRGNSWKGVFDVQRGYLKRAIMNTTRSIEAIMLDKNINFDAWFRCLMTKEPIPSVIQKWGYYAAQELKNPELIAFLNHLKVTEGLSFDLSRIPNYRS